MLAVPTHEMLLATLGRTYTLKMADGMVVDARLADAPAGIAMDDTYVCYSAVFELPSAVQLPQELYRVTSPDGDAWDLLATPTRPTASGAAVLTAVIHCTRSTFAASNAGDA